MTLTEAHAYSEQNHVWDGVSHTHNRQHEELSDAPIIPVASIITEHDYAPIS